MARLYCVSEYIPRQDIVKVVESQVEQPHHFLSVLTLHEMLRSSTRIHGLVFISKLWEASRDLVPCPHVGMQVRQDEINWRLSLSAEMSIYGLLNCWCRSAAAGAEVDEGVG